MLQIINLDPDCRREERSTDLANNLYTSQLCSSIIYGTEVTVNVKPTSHTLGSSLVTTKNITNYAWAMEKMPGTLISIHCSGKYVAYAIKGPTGHGMVRIINCDNSVRGLIKNIAGVVRDVSFAFLTDRIFLACVDQFGSLFVYEIFDEETNLRTELKLQVVDLGNDSQRAKFWHQSGLQRVVWCPYIPEDPLEEEADEENCALMLTVTNGSVAEVWHLGMVLAAVENPILDHEVKTGYHMISDHAGAITDAAFSPDGTALATASMDGYVKFFQMKFDGESLPRCLHQWNPHNSQPVSCLFFLDNYKHPNVDGLWKYAVTGANNNTELKVWSCQNWKCHQTVTFNLCEDSDKNAPYLNFKASIDPSSRHIILNDNARRVLCVAILNQDPGPSNEEEEQEDEVVKFISISEIAMQTGVICLAISDAAFKIYKQWKEESQLSPDECDDDNDMKIVEGLVMQCFLINHKSLQEAVIKFQPCMPLHQLRKGPQILNLSSSQDCSISLQDGLTDLSLTMNASTFDSQNESTFMEEESGAASFPNSVPQEIHDNGILSPIQTTNKVEAILSPPPSEALPHLLTPESFNPIPKEELDILNEVGLHVGPLQELAADVDSEKDVATSKKRPLSAVSISNNGILFNGTRRSKGTEEWGNQLSGAVASSPSAPLRPPLIKSFTDDCEVVASPATANLLQPLDIRAVTASSSTSSPSLEVQQILHNGKIDEFLDAEEDSPENEKTTLENGANSLVDILSSLSANKKQPMANVWESQPPLLPTSTLLTPTTMSMAKEILNLQVANGNETCALLEASTGLELGDTKVLPPTIAVLCSSQTTSDQAPQLAADSSNESPLGGIFQLGSLPPISKHMTCEQLEAHMKSETPVPKSVDNLQWDVTSNTMAMPHLSDVPVANGSTFRDFYDQFSVIQNDLESIKKSLAAEDSKVKEQKSDNASYAAKLSNVTERINKQQKKLETITKQIEGIKELEQKSLEALPKLVASNIKSVLENDIKKDIKFAVQQATAKSMEIFSAGMKSDIRYLLSTFERQMADQISRVVHSKPFLESVSGGFVNSFSSSVSASVKECHNKVLVPSMSVSAQQMFAQMNDAFSRGTKEYITHVQTETKAIESTINERLTKVCLNLESAAEKMAKNKSQTDGMTEAVECRMRTMMREEISKALQEQNALLERQSRSQTPMSTVQSPFSVKNAQQQLQTYISRQEFNNAFKHALMLSDLSLVVFVCERVNPHQLFSHSPCPLTQDVLLSLISQLSFDLSTYTDLKIKYLEEAVMTLDMNQQVTKDHVRQVLGECRRALTNHLSINPNQKKLKMLLLAVNQLLSSA